MRATATVVKNFYREFYKDFFLCKVLLQNLVLSQNRKNHKNVPGRILGVKGCENFGEELTDIKNTIFSNEFQTRNNMNYFPIFSNFSELNRRSTIPELTEKLNIAFGSVQSIINKDN